MPEPFVMLFSVGERIVNEAKYICETGATVRQTAPLFGVCKSCVHKDVTVRLKEIDEELYRRVRGVLEKNFTEKHLRGGKATKEKYAHKER